MTPEEVIGAIEPFVAANAILTRAGKGGEPVVDIHRRAGGALAFGDDETKAVEARLQIEIASLIRSGGGIVLRSFTALRDVGSGLPVKELRGWSVNDGVTERLKPRALRAACLTDAPTGEALPPAPAVVHPGAGSDRIAAAGERRRS